MDKDTNNPRNPWPPLAVWVPQNRWARFWVFLSLATMIGVGFALATGWMAWIPIGVVVGVIKGVIFMSYGVPARNQDQRPGRPS